MEHWHLLETGNQCYSVSGPQLLTGYPGTCFCPLEPPSVQPEANVFVLLRGSGGTFEHSIHVVQDDSIIREGAKVALNRIFSFKVPPVGLSTV